MSCSCSIRGRDPSSGRNHARRPAQRARRLSGPGRGILSGDRRQLGSAQRPLAQQGDPLFLHPGHGGGDHLATPVEVDQELLEIRDGGGLDLVEHFQIRALGAQEPLEFAVEGLGVLDQGLQVPFQFPQGAEDPPIGRGGLAGQQAQLVEPVGDRLQYGRLERPRRGENLQRVPHSGESGLAPAGQ